jgi:hypothetical protein
MIAPAVEGCVGGKWQPGVRLGVSKDGGEIVPKPATILLVEIGS